MKKINLIFTFLCLVVFTGSSQSSLDSGFRVKLNSHFEVFDSVYFKKNKKYDTAFDTLKDGNILKLYVSAGPWEKSISTIETSSSSSWRLAKYYYPNGNINMKGFDSNANPIFEIGTWYYFDEQGNLADSIDYDKGFDFTYEDVLEFIRQENPRVLSETNLGKVSPPSIKEDGTLKNIYVSRGKTKEGKPVWTISWILTRLFGYEIGLDGSTGKIVWEAPTRKYFMWELEAQEAARREKESQEK